MDALHKQMTLDLELRGLAKHTKSEYLRYARLFAAYHQRSPEDMGEREIQQFLRHRLVDDKVSYATLKVTVAALRFLYATSLKRPEVALAIVSAASTPSFRLDAGEATTGHEAQGREAAAA